jgi:hypothetical protein
VDLVSGQESERRELHRDHYRRAESRMKKVDDTVTKPTVTLAIQGMCVSDDPGSVNALLFDHCVDEHDSLAIFQYRDPRILLELVDRRMVQDISKYLDGYTKSRLEPPSFIVTPEELQSYVHLPAGETTISLSSLGGGTSTRGFTTASVDGEEANRGEVSSSLVRLVAVPKIEKALEDSSVQPLARLASSTARTFELGYRNGGRRASLSRDRRGDEEVCWFAGHGVRRVEVSER